MNPQQASKRIREYMRMTGKTLAEITMQGAKVAAEWLAEVTPPRGKGSDARAIGFQAVESDIKRLFPVNLWNDIRRSRGRDAADRFWTVFSAWRGKSTKRKNAGWQDIVSALQGTGVEPSTNPKEAHAKARRNGKTYLNPKYLAKNQRDVQRLIKEKQKAVGYSKGGWGDAARQLGNSRLPKWMNGPGRGTLQSTGNKHVAKAENLVAWADKITPRQQKKMADALGQRRVLEMMGKAIRAIRAKTGN